MSKAGSGIWRRWLSRAVLLLLLIAAVASFLPLVEANAWWIRYADFPRLQLSVALLVLVGLFAVICGRPCRGGWLVVLLAVLAVGYHAWHLYPYSRTVAPVAVQHQREGEAHGRIGLLDFQEPAVDQRSLRAEHSDTAST